MAIVWRLGSGFTSGTDYTTSSSASASSITANKPGGVVDGVTLRAFAFSQVSAGAAMTAPSGWTLESAPTLRRGGIYSKFIPTASAETATSYTWSCASAGRMDVAIWISTGEGSTPVDVSATWTSESTTSTAPSVTATNANDVLAVFAYWNNSNTTSSTVNYPGGQTKLLDLSSPNTGNTSGISIGYEQLSSSGATGTRALTATPTPTNMASVSIAYNAGVSTTTASFTGTGTFSAAVSQSSSSNASFAGSGAFSVTVNAITLTTTAPFTGSGSFLASVGDNHITNAPFGGTGAFSSTLNQGYVGTAPMTGSGAFSAVYKPGYAVNAGMSGTGTFGTLSPVDQWLANQPNYVAHRGGSADWPEMTMYAYAQATAWNPNLALEISCIRTSDGLWMASHDSTTDRVFGVHYDITTTPWSTLQTLRTTNGNQPPCLLTDVLAAYPNQICVVDDKMNSYLSNFLDTLDAYGGNQRIIVKGYGPQSGDITKAQAALARGYRTWGYYYHADTANLPSTQSNWTILGEDAVGSPPGDATDWAAIKSYGKPVWAHIIATATQKTYADTFSPNGYMASGVMEVVPQGGATLSATFAGTGNFSASAKQSYSANAPFVGSGILTGLAVQAYQLAAAMSGAGSFTSSAGNQFVATAPFTGIGNLNAALVQKYIQTAQFGGQGTFAGFGIQGYSVNAALTASGQLVFQVVTPTGGFAVYVWSGATLVPASVKVWNGTSLVNSQVAEVV